LSAQLLSGLKGSGGGSIREEDLLKVISESGGGKSSKSI
jgi:hypothetical protein